MACKPFEDGGEPMAMSFEATLAQKRHLVDLGEKEGGGGQAGRVFQEQVLEPSLERQ